MTEEEFILVMTFWGLFMGFIFGGLTFNGEDFVEPQISAEDAIKSAEFQGYAQCTVDRIYNDKVHLNCLTDDDAVADSREVVVGYTTERDVGVIS